VRLDLNILRNLPLFAAVSDEGLRALSERLQLRYYSEGDVILRAGEPASELHVIVEGAAQVDLGTEAGRARRAVVGAGQTIGEMSLLTDAAVSATVTAQCNTTTLAFGPDVLLALLDREPVLYRVFLAQLADRLRHRTHVATLRPTVAVLELLDDAGEIGAVVTSLARGVQHYAPGSVCFPAPVTPGDVVRPISEWRHKAAGGQYLMLTLGAGGPAAVRHLLEAGDVVLTITTDQSRAIEQHRPAGAADSRVLTVGSRGRNRHPWVHCVALDEARAASAGVWSRGNYPDIDRVVRYITSREIGIALSVGAAAGLAHLGFLEVLERAEIPMDYLCGSSMGGAVALAYGAFGSAERASEAICRVGAEFARAKGIQLLPRAALVAQRRMRRMADEVFGEHRRKRARDPRSGIRGRRSASHRGDSGAVPTSPVGEPHLSRWWPCKPNTGGPASAPPVRSDACFNRALPRSADNRRAHSRI
jgi:NTE family protein